MQSRPRTTTDPIKALARHINDLGRRVRGLELRTDPTSGVTVPPSVPPYAIQVKRHSGSLIVATATDTQVQFDNETPYFENVNGEMWPPDYPDGSMFDKDDRWTIITPVEGLWGFRANYRYVSGLPQGTYAYTIVRRNGSTPVGIEHVPTGAVPTATGTPASVFGTAYQSAGDSLSLFLRQESGSNKTVQLGGLKDDIPTSGVVFAVWLISPRS